MKLNIQLFASGTINGTTSGAKPENQCRIVWSSVGDASTNKSELTITVQWRRNTGTTSMKSTGTFSGTLKVDGISYNISKYGDWYYAAWRDVYSKKVTITHNSDGTKSVPINCTYSHDVATYMKGTYKITGTITLDTLHRAPDNISYTITETNADLVGVQNDTFVQFLSKKRFDITATTYDDSTITEYAVLNGPNTPYIYTSPTTPINIDFTNVPIAIAFNSFPIRIRITDSEGGIGYDSSIPYPFIPYTKPEFEPTSTTTKRNGQTSGRVLLNVVGNYYNGNVGDIPISPTVSYRFWQKGTTEPSTWINIPNTAIVLDSGNLSITNYEIGSNITTDPNYFDYQKSYDIKIKIEDQYYESIILKGVPVGEAIWTEYKDRVDFKKLTIQGEPIIQSDIVITSTNTPPDDSGNWQLIDKEFTQYATSSGTAITWNSTNTTAASCVMRYTRIGHSLNFSFTIVNKVQIKDDTLAIGTLKLADLGIDAIPIIQNITGWTDGGNCAVFFYISTAGAIETRDIIPDSYVSAGALTFLTFTVPITYGHMLDSACSKFYWKRTN